jgi:hypothetical protein
MIQARLQPVWPPPCARRCSRTCARGRGELGCAVGGDLAAGVEGEEVGHVAVAGLDLLEGVATTRGCGRRLPMPPSRGSRPRVAHAGSVTTRRRSQLGGGLEELVKTSQMICWSIAGPMQRRPRSPSGPRKRFSGELSRSGDEQAGAGLLDEVVEVELGRPPAGAASRVLLEEVAVAGEAVVLHEVLADQAPPCGHMPQTELADGAGEPRRRWCGGRRIRAS